MHLGGWAEGSMWDWTYAVEDHERFVTEGFLEICPAGFEEKMLAQEQCNRPRIANKRCVEGEGKSCPRAGESG